MAWQPDEYIPFNGTYVPARYVQPQFWPPDPRDANPEVVPDDPMGLDSPAAAPMPQPVVTPPVQPIASPGPSVDDVLAGKPMAGAPSTPAQPVASIQGQMSQTAPVKAAEQILADTRPPGGQQRSREIAPISEVAANAELGLPPTAGAIEEPAKPEPEVDPMARAPGPPTEAEQRQLLDPDYSDTYSSDPLIASAQRQAEAVAQAEFAARAAQEAKQREVERIVKAREAERAKQEQSLQAARGDIDAATKAYQAQLRTEPEDRTTRNLLTILFSSLAAGLSKGKLANNAMELIQRGMEQSERERVAKVASAKAEVDRVRQRYGDISADFDAAESVVQQRLAAQELLYAERLKTFAAQAKSVQSAEQATTMAASLEAQAQQRMAAEAEKRAEAERKRKAEEDKQKLEREKFELSQAKEKREAKDSAALRAQRYAEIAAQRERLAIERERAKNEAERNAVDSEIKNIDLEKKQLDIQEMVQDKTVKFPGGFTYQAPTKAAAEEVVAGEMFARDAIYKIDKLLRIDANVNKQFWSTPEAQEAESLYATMLADIKGPSFSQLGVPTGGDMEFLKRMAGKLTTDSWISQRKSLETLRNTILAKRGNLHAYRGHYEGKVPEIAQELDPSAAEISTDDGLALLRTATTAAGTVKEPEERLSGLEIMKGAALASGSPKARNDLYLKWALELDREEADIRDLRLQSSQLAASGQDTSSIDQMIRKREQVAQGIKAARSDIGKRISLSERNALNDRGNQLARRRDQARQRLDRTLQDFQPLDTSPEYKEFKQILETRGKLDAAQYLYEVNKGKKSLPDIGTAIRRYKSAFED